MSAGKEGTHDSWSQSQARNGRGNRKLLVGAFVFSLALGIGGSAAPWYQGEIGELVGDPRGAAGTVAALAVIGLLVFVRRRTRPWLVISLVAGGLGIAVALEVMSGAAGTAARFDGFGVSGSATDILGPGVYITLTASLGLILCMGGLLLDLSKRGSAEASRSTGTTASASMPPAAWHPDPHGTKRLRYWDGQAWTDHVAD